MRRYFFGALGGAVVAVLAAGCVEDPTGTLLTDPDRVVTSATSVSMFVGDSVLVTARTLDEQGNPMAALPTLASADEAVATVRDTTVPPLPQSAYYIRGIGAGQTTVTASAGGVSQDIRVIVIPTSFGGSVTVSSGARIDTVVIAASSNVTFDASGSTTVEINGTPADIISLTADEIKVSGSSAGGATGATVTLFDLVFLGGIPLDELDAATTVDLAADRDEPTNDSFSTPTAMAMGSTQLGTVDANDVDDWFQVTLAADGTITFDLEFVGDGGHPDIDLIVYDASLSLVGFAASLANPESFQSGTLTAGDYLIWVNLWDGAGAPEPYWYRLTASTP